MLMVIFVAVVGAIISAVVGTLWYSMATPMGRVHMESIGFTKLSKKQQEMMIAKAKPHMWKSYTAQMFLSLLTSFFIAFVTWYSVESGAPATSVYVYIPFIWLTFTVPMIGQNLLWGNVDEKLRIKKFFSDAAYNLVTYLLIATAAVIIL